MNKVFKVNLSGWAGEPNFFIIVAENEVRAREIAEEEKDNSINITDINEIPIKKEGLHTISY